MLLRRPPTRNVSILTETTHEVLEDGQTVINFITFYIQKLAEKEIPKTVLILLTGNLLQLFINNFELIFIYACFNVSSSEEEEDNIEDFDDDEEEVHDNVAVNLELPSAGHAIASVTADASPHAEVIAEASASPSAKRRRGSSAAIPSSPPTTSSIAVVRQKAAAASKNGGRKK